jgi:hypothetical protein
LLLAPVCASAGAAMGMPALIRQLASDDALLRQDAVDQLMCLRRADLPALREAAVAQCPLLPAQVTGLHQVVTQVFLAGERFRIDPTEGEYPRGFLGIRFSTNPADRLQRTDGVMIADRIRGFPAFRQLRSGDVIMKIIDWPAVQLHSSDDFVRAVTMLAAGDEIHLISARKRSRRRRRRTSNRPWIPGLTPAIAGRKAIGNTSFRRSIRRLRPTIRRLQLLPSNERYPATN